MTVIDATTSHDGSIWLLYDNGSLWHRERASDIAYQHLSPTLRPQWTFVEVKVPLGTTKVLPSGPSGDLYVIAGGVLHQRVRDDKDPTNLWRPAWIWRAVEMPSTPEGTYTQPEAQPQVKILTVDDAGTDTGGPRQQRTQGAPIRGFWVESMSGTIGGGVNPAVWPFSIDLAHVARYRVTANGHFVLEFKDGKDWLPVTLTDNCFTARAGDYRFMAGGVESTAILVERWEPGK